MNEDLREGTRLGKYMIMDMIGGGTYGTVYRAQDSTTGAMVAVKMLNTLENPSPYLTREVVLAFFELEAIATAALKGKTNVVELIEDHARDPPHYIVYELLEGAPLSMMLDELGSLDETVACTIALEVAKALGAVHREGFVHRDVKPSNIMILPNGGVRLIDLGTAAYRPDGKRSDAFINLDPDGAAMGTPWYMSPETAQALDLRYNVHVDLYSLGVVLYEMVTGRLPFDSHSTWYVMNAHVLTRPPSLRGKYAGSPLERIIMRSLAKNPKDRYACANDFASALRWHLGAQKG